MSYFSDHADLLNLKVKHEEKDVGIRECQIGAFWSLMGHFTAQDIPALVSLPTGAGKTALMMLLAFGLNAKRVLIITPTDVLREQTGNKFQGLDGLKLSKAFPEDAKGPRVHKQKSRITSRTQWNSLSKYDVVVALPHVISTGYHQDIVAPPEYLFDLVLYDEAHHMNAPSWHKLLGDYQRAKQVLLTATPFRRDKRRLPGRLTYFYPLTKAMSTGLYHPVNYEPVFSRSPANRNVDLRDRAVQIFNCEKEKYTDVKLLIRTDNIKEAKLLENLYSDEGLKVEAVHSHRTPKQNEDALQRLKDGKINGIIGVGMLGEGLDIPSLKIAVFHSPPRSFPFTIQLIGRVARPISSSSVSAYVIADPDQLREKGVEEEVRRLYRDDRGWKDLIPDLVEEVAGSVLRDVRHGSSDLLLGANVNDLRPFFSTRLYHVEDTEMRLYSEIDLGDDIGVYLLPGEEGDDFLGLITEVQKAPAWGARTGIETSQFDLHLYYYHSPSKILFESTTSDLLATDIRSQIVQGKIQRVGGDTLVRVMQSSGEINYIAAGLANALGPTSAIPSYKIFLGQQVQGAINPSDARVFVRGHVFAKIGEQETRGISDGQGRVWASKRGSISDFVNWCSDVGNDLVCNKVAIAPTDFAFFSLPDRITRFPKKPILVLPNPNLELLSLTLFDLSDRNEVIELDQLPLIIGKFLSGKRKILRVDMFAKSNIDSIELRYDVESNTWTVFDTASMKMRVDYGHEHEDLPIEKFFNRFPPWFYMPEGGVIKGGFLYKVKPSYDHLPASCHVANLDWSDCDIVLEYENDSRQASAGKKSVHDWLQCHLEFNATENTIIFKDHGSGEIADFVVFDSDEKVVHLYHCKGCPKYSKGPKKGKANIGATIGHVKEVFDQVARSNVWVKTKNLINQIKDRNERDNKSCFIKGSNLFDELCRVFVPAEWNYKVFIVNPGLEVNQARNNENTNIILLTCYEWLRGIGTDLHIMGFNE